MTTPTRPDLDAIEKRAQAVIEDLYEGAPWTVKARDIDAHHVVAEVDGDEGPGLIVADCIDDDGAAFLAACRTDVPALVAWCRELEARLADTTMERDAHLAAIEHLRGELEAERPKARAEFESFCEAIGMVNRPDQGSNGASYPSARALRDALEVMGREFRRLGELEAELASERKRNAQLCSCIYGWRDRTCGVHGDREAGE